MADPTISASLQPSFSLPQPAYEPPVQRVTPLQQLQAAAAEHDKQELAAGATKNTTPTQIYTVAERDTPASIAARFDIPLKDLKAVNQNRIGDQGQIRIGAQLVLPPNAKTDLEAHGPRDKAGGKVRVGDTNSIEDKYGRPAWTQRYLTRGQSPSTGPAAHAPEVKPTTPDTKPKQEPPAAASVSPRLKHPAVTSSGATKPSEVVRQARAQLGRLNDLPALDELKKAANASSASSTGAKPTVVAEQPPVSRERTPLPPDLRYASNETRVTLGTTSVSVLGPDRVR